MTNLLNADDLQLPDPLTTAAGNRVTTPAEWKETRRPEILELFETNIYGRAPADMGKVSFEVIEEASPALGVKAIRKQVAIQIETDKGSLRMDLLLYLPSGAKDQPVPVFTLLNFSGNHTVNDDPAILIAKNLQQKLRQNDSQPNPENARGAKAARFPIEELTRRGYGLATVFYGDIDPDFDDGFRNGIHPLFDPDTDKRPSDAWGSVSAWAWGLSRIMDYLETDPQVDHSRVALLGHSRLGKAALWAGALDERFSIVISNNSGSTGAALARQKEGETVAAINESFPHWFCDNYKLYNDREDKLPVDQHMLLSLMAPRPVYVASATNDRWAGPRNEFLSAVHAGPVYRLFGLEGLNSTTMPPPDTPLNTGSIGYHIRTGKHDLTAYDWACYMDFTDRFWKEAQH